MTESLWDTGEGWETVETVEVIPGLANTQLKQGINERTPADGSRPTGAARLIRASLCPSSASDAMEGWRLLRVIGSTKFTTKVGDKVGDKVGVMGEVFCITSRPWRRCRRVR